ncbi:MAG: hypothetical protein IPG25_15320 [Proteobacteria bacterium]|jgi:hypothetical protein|nr:hypothetical protein [Pseudomonadota bacterium]
MSDMTIPAANEASTDTAAPQVTTQETTHEQDAPQADKGQAGEPQAKPEAKADEPPAGREDVPEGEQPKTWKEKKQERNRQRWQEYKSAREVMPRRLEMLEKEVARLKGGDPPDFTQIADPNEELAERTAWKVRQANAKEASDRLESEREAIAYEHHQKLAAAWAETVESARETMPDFDQVFTSDTPVHERAVRHIAESDMGAEIAYYLGKNPQEAASLYQSFASDPARALKEFGKLEAKLSRPTAAKPTSAPRPAAPISGGVTPVGFFDPDKGGVGDMAAYLRTKGVIR